MIIQATPSNYWISPTALHFSLNALDNVDYIHANASGDASILVYIKDIIDYDNAHNYRKFQLSLSSTYFGSVDPKYIYVAIPRTLDNTIPSIVVFPSKQIDVYGKEIIINSDSSLSQGDQLGDEKYYYIFLQGIISASETASAVVNRTWTHEIETGILASDEASVAGSDNGWWLYNAVTELVTFTKKIASAAINDLNIKNLIFGNGTIKSIVDTENYQDTDNDSIATPKFVSFFGNKTYLSKLNDDVAKGIIDFEKGIKINGNAINDIITSESDIQDTDTLIMSVAKQLATFMRKDISDSTDFIQTFTKGIKALLVQSGNYTTGMLGAGFTLKNDASGDSYIEVDRGLFRKTVTFYELLIQNIKSVGGQILLSPTQMNCIKVEEQTDSYRCYFKNNEDGKVIYNEFEVNDLARRQDFNVKTGSKYYWRKVIAIGDDYIDLSKTDCDTGSGIPEVGDDIIQIGNSSDVARQGAIILSAYGPDSPYIKIYQGINSYLLTGKERATLSPSKMDITADSFRFSTGEKIKDYIDKGMIIPCGDYILGTNYLKNSLVTFNNQIFISLVDTSDCPIVVLADENGSPLVDENGSFITPTDSDGNVTYNPSWKFYSSNEALENDVTKFKRTTDATFQILNDEVASKVSSTTFNALGQIVDEHSSAIEQFPENISASISNSVKTDGTIYKAIATSFTMNDDGISLFGKSLVFTGTAIFTGINDRIQSKAHTFTSQPTDTDAYNVGDIWLNATYGTYDNDILKCVTAKAANVAFDIAHWAIASKYTDDSAASAAAHDLSDYKAAMVTTINGLQGQIDGEVDSWFMQADPTVSNAPAIDWTTDILKQRHANDTYTNTATGASWKWVQTDGIWGWTIIADTATQKALANAVKAQDTADGKRRVFTAQPTSDSIYDIGDIWVNATVDTFVNDLLVCITAKAQGASFNIAHWKLASKYTDDTKATNALNYRETFAKNLGYANLTDMETQATLPEKKTIIKNGMVNTDLLEVNTILFNALHGNIIDALDATIENLKLNNVIVNGSSKSPFGENNDSFIQGITDNIALFNDQSSSSYMGYNISNDITQNGRELTITNFKYTEDGTIKESIGPILISLSNTGYIYDNGNGFTGVALHKGEYVKLLGYGNSNTFFGWIVINRGNINQNDISYGKSWKVLAQGKVTGTTTSISIYARTYNNATNFTIVRNSIGYYTVTCPSYIKITNINEVLIMATGIGESYGDPVGTYSPIKVSVRNVSIVNGNLTIEFMVSDDATPNDGSFGFTITNMLDWVS